MDRFQAMKVFMGVAEASSFTRAADNLGVPRATVTTTIQGLENLLKVRLLNRTTRSVSLTDAGALLLERSAPLVEMIDLTRDELLQRAHLPSGRVRITAPHALGGLELPQLLAEFMQTHPLVQISLDLNNRMIDLVDEGVDVVGMRHQRQVGLAAGGQQRAAQRHRAAAFACHVQYLPVMPATFR